LQKVVLGEVELSVRDDGGSLEQAKRSATKIDLFGRNVSGEIPQSIVTAHKNACGACSVQLKNEIFDAFLEDLCNLWKLVQLFKEVFDDRIVRLRLIFWGMFPSSSSAAHRLGKTKQEARVGEASPRKRGVEGRKMYELASTTTQTNILRQHMSQRDNN
jgi:hypothetical protein